MEQRYFPIKTATACQLKWNWSTLFLTTGTTSSCHRTFGGSIDPEVIKLVKDNIKRLRNLEI
jgi:hypothetical protein